MSGSVSVWDGEVRGLRCTIHTVPCSFGVTDSTDAVELLLRTSSQNIKRTFSGLSYIDFDYELIICLQNYYLLF